jgi:hypothetical protein
LNPSCGRSQNRSAATEGANEVLRYSNVECDKCDAEYVISHKRRLKKSSIVAAEQAAQLKTILSEDHDPKDRREHPDLVEFE